VFVSRILSGSFLSQSLQCLLVFALCTDVFVLCGNFLFFFLPCLACVVSRFFWAPSFEVYGGSRGLYDLGPSAAAIQNNLLAFWRQHFVLGESMLELETTVLTPEKVLVYGSSADMAALVVGALVCCWCFLCSPTPHRLFVCLFVFTSSVSEHVTKFKDFMVRDMKTDDCFRADHLLEDALDALLEKADPSTAEHAEMTVARNSADAYSRDDLQAQLRKYNVVAPVTGNDISDVFDFNLMFPTKLGPHGDHLAYMRPETAQVCVCVCVGVCPPHLICFYVFSSSLYSCVCVCVYCTDALCFLSLLVSPFLLVGHLHELSSFDGGGWRSAAVRGHHHWSCVPQ
jgi:hypothetical protein